MTLSIAQVNVNQRGGITAIVLRGSDRFTHTFEQSAESPFNPGSYDKDEAAYRQHCVSHEGRVWKIFEGMES